MLFLLPLYSEQGTAESVSRILPAWGGPTMEAVDYSGFSPTEMVVHCHRCVAVLVPPKKEEAMTFRGPNANRDRSLHVVELLSRALFTALVTGHASNKVAQCCRSLLTVVSGWLFPEKLSWGRACVHVSRIWAMLQGCASAIWLIRCRQVRHARLVGQCFPPSFRDLLWDRRAIVAEGGLALLHQTAHRYVQTQLIAASLPGSAVSPEAVVYAWVGHKGVYLGLARTARVKMPMLSGVAQRWLEHERMRWKTHIHEASRRRYVLARQERSCGRSFVVIRSGSLHHMSAFESLSIRTLAPCLNDGICHGLRGQQRWSPSPRRRPPPSARRRPAILPQAGGIPEGKPLPYCIAGEDGLPFRHAPAQPACRRGPLRVRHPGVASVPPQCRDAVGGLPSSITRVSPWQWHPLLGVPVPHDLQRAWWWTQGYTYIYRMYQRFHLPCSGPLFIYEPFFWPCLLAWMNTVGAAFDWLPIQRAWGTDIPAACILLSRAVSCITAPVRLQRARGALNKAFGRSRLPGLAKVVVKVSAASHLLPARTLWKQVLECSPISLVVKGWLRQQVHFVAASPFTFLKRCNASSRSKWVEWEQMIGSEPTLLASHVLLKSAYKIEERWDIEVRRAPAQHAAEIRAAVGSVFRRFPFVHRGWSPWVRGQEMLHLAPLHPSFQRAMEFQRASSWQYQCQVQRMHPRRGWVLMHDDKDKKCCWQVPAPVFDVCCLNYITNSEHWVLTCLSIPEAEELTFRALSLGIPERLHRQLGLSPKRTWLPHLYPTVKSKCVDASGGGRTCVKPGHSCCRKVVSFCQWPRRTEWRALSRAMETMMKRHSGSLEAWSLRDVVPVFLARWRRVRDFAVKTQARLRVCMRCGCPKPLWDCAVLDAGQFFESVCSDSVGSACQFALDAARRGGHAEVVSVQLCRNRRAWSGGNIANPRRGVRRFTLEEVAESVRAVSGLSYARVGTGVASPTGLMIGSRASKVACSLVLGKSESEWCSDHARREAEGFHGCMLAWEDVVATARYVDDVFACSPFFCYKCLEFATNAMSPAPFDLQEHGSSVGWTDVQVEMPDELHLLPRIDWREKKISLPPSWDRPVAALRAFIIGRAARWREISLPPERVPYHFMRIHAAAAEVGWGPRHWRWCLHTFKDRSHVPVFAALSQCLHAASRGVHAAPHPRG